MLEGVEPMDIQVSNEREKETKEFWNKLWCPESILKQKSRVRWVKQGDLNTKFFHSSLKARRRQNYLLGVNTKAGRVDTVDGVKHEVKSFFEAKLRESTFC